MPHAASHSPTLSTDGRLACQAVPVSRLLGRITPPGDKSISHRALMLGTLAIGETTVTGLLEGEDIMATAAAMQALGGEWVREGTGRWRIQGVGIGGLREPDNLLDMGNAGTAARLILGMLASHPVTAFLTGDASLRRRPMARVIAPLTEIGARFVTRRGGLLPLSVQGASDPLPIQYRLPVASAQVKSAILLSALNIPGRTTVHEPVRSRDHTETMLAYFGAELTIEHPGEGRLIHLAGQPELTGQHVTVPADPSSAAFPLVAALVLPGSEVTVCNVGINPQRIGLIQCLQEMGGEITLLNRREAGGEPVADIQVSGSRLKGIAVPPERAPSMIDEYPILAIAAAAASGVTSMTGLGELRVKESDRLMAIARGLAACGVRLEMGDDSLIIFGCGGRPKGGGRIETGLDHRIAMAFLVMGLVAETAVTVDDTGPIETSFPGFIPLMQQLGADMRMIEGGE